MPQFLGIDSSTQSTSGLVIDTGSRRVIFDLSINYGRDLPQYQAPEGPTETVLAQIWSDVLQVEQVGRQDHFFELGGHSLLAVNLISRMREHGMEADVRGLFEQPTLAGYAAMTERMEIVL